MTGGYVGVAVVSEGLVIQGGRDEARRSTEGIGAGLAGVVLAPSDALDRIAWAVERPALMDQGALDAFARMTMTMQDVYCFLPVGALLEPARAHLGAITKALNGSVPAAHRPRLTAVAGATSQLVASLSRSAGQWGEAQRYNAAAATLGRDAGHAGVEARALGGLAQLYSEAPWLAGARTAADYAEQASRAAATGPMDARSRSWLAA